MPATFRTGDNDSNVLARYPVNVVQTVTDFVNADGTTPKKITGGDTTVLGARLDLMIFSSNDAAANIFYFYMHDGTTLSTIPFAYIAVPSTAGTDGATPQVSVLRSTDWDSIVSLDNNGNPFMMLTPGYSLYAAPVLAVTASQTIQVITWVHDY